MDTKEHNEHAHSEHAHSAGPHHVSETHPHSPQNNQKKKINYTLILGISLAAILIINLILIFSLHQSYKKVLAEEIERNKPALISMTIIKNSGCEECYDINKVVSTIKENNVNVTSERTLEFSDPEAKNLIMQNNIKKLPTVIVTGEINKTGNMDLALKNSVLLFEQLTPVYYDLALNKEVGKVTLINIKDSSCKNCTDLSSLPTQLIRAGVIISDEKTLDIAQAQEYVAKYNLTKIPTVVFSSDLSAYSGNQILASWDKIGTVEYDGSYILRAVPPPYKDLSTNSVRGLVDLIYLTDNSCTQCYNVTLHKLILARFGLFLNSEKSIDTSSTEGKNLVSKYKITKVPTIVLSKEAKDYESFVELWSQVGTIENDNVFIFRNFEVLNVPYKDLTTNSVIEPNPVQDTGGST